MGVWSGTGRGGDGAGENTGGGAGCDWYIILGGGETFFGRRKEIVVLSIKALKRKKSPTSIHMIDIIIIK